LYREFVKISSSCLSKSKSLIVLYTYWYLLWTGQTRKGWADRRNQAQPIKNVKRTRSTGIRTYGPFYLTYRWHVL
jgi:hypothetical protein